MFFYSLGALLSLGLNSHSAGGIDVPTDLIAEGDNKGKLEALCQGAQYIPFPMSCPFDQGQCFARSLQVTTTGAIWYIYTL